MLTCLGRVVSRLDQQDVASKKQAAIDPSSPMASQDHNLTIMMKCAIILATLLGLFSQVASFAPTPRAFVPQTTVCRMAEDVSLDDEVEALVQEELNKNMRMSNLRNERGIEYAPWMKISKEEEAKIRVIMREKAKARRKRQVDNENAKGSLLKDSTYQEIGGTGLKYKVIDGNAVELEWATAQEKSTKGFIVKRRAAKTDDFSVLASYETYGPLVSKGVDGGIYRFLDEDVAPGGYVYRVTECEANGDENDLSQCLVEIQTEEEQRGAVLAVGAFGIVAILAVVAGTLLDPVQY